MQTATNLPIRFAEENAPHFLCIDCGDVEVSDDGERCADCECCREENARDAEGDRQMERERDAEDSARDVIWDAVDSFGGRG